MINYELCYCFSRNGTKETLQICSENFPHVLAYSAFTCFLFAAIHSLWSNFVRYKSRVRQRLNWSVLIPLSVFVTNEVNRIEYFFSFFVLLIQYDSSDSIYTSVELVEKCNLAMCDVQLFCSENWQLSEKLNNFVFAEPLLQKYSK